MNKKIYLRWRSALVLIAVLLALSPAVSPAGGRVESVQATSEPETLPALQGEQAIGQLKELGLYDSLRKAVEAVAYEMRREEQPPKGEGAETYYAPNPAQQLEAYFSPDGLNLAPSKEEAPQWELKMRLSGYGYSDAWITAGLAELQASGNQIDYRRTPGIREWYVNSSKGLEQGFTVEAAPGGRHDGEWLRLALALTGDLRAEAVEEGRAIAFKQEDGELVLRYSDLHAYDSQGRELPTQMKVTDEQVYLEVDERNATYPLTIDPIFSQEHILGPSDGGEGDAFGNSVAISGDIAVVGAPYDDIEKNVDQGSAYVFLRSPNGAGWIFDQKLIADSGAAGDKFGFSVAIALEIMRLPCFCSVPPYYYEGRVESIVIGVPDDDDDGGLTNRGSAIVFQRDNSTSAREWLQRQKLTAPDGDAWDRFGSSVAAIGHWIVIGSPNDKIDLQNQGSAHVFYPSTFSLSASWRDWNQKLIANSGSTTGRFGSAVAIDEDTIVVGAPGYNTAFIFGYGAGVWSQQQSLTAISGSFGNSVAIDRSTLVVGAPLESVQNQQNQGAAHVFVRSSSRSWNWKQRLVAADGTAGDGFGHSVSIQGNTVAVGAPGDDIAGNSDQGSAYIFSPTPITWTYQWTQQQKLTLAGNTKPAAFGGAVAVDGLAVLVGVPGEGRLLQNGFYRTGSAHVFVSP